MEGKKGYVDDYKLIALLAKTMDSLVYLCHHKDHSETPLVVKLMIHAVLLSNKKHSKLLNFKAYLQEGFLMQELDHPNILRVIRLKEKGMYYSKKDRETPYIILPFLKNDRMFTYLKKTGSLTEPEARYYFGQLTSAIAHMHERGFVHMDLKNENYLLDDMFQLLVADFGHSIKVTAADDEGRLENFQVGTEGYNPPEITKKERYEPKPVDIFMAGISLLLMVTAKPILWKDASSKAYTMFFNDKQSSKKFWEHFRSPASLTNPLSEQLQDLLTGMLLADARQRPTIEEVRQHPWLQGQTATAAEVRWSMENRRHQILAAQQEKFSAVTAQTTTSNLCKRLTKPSEGQKIECIEEKVSHHSGTEIMINSVTVEDGDIPSPFLADGSPLN